jgi:hypothetical protein
MKKLVVVFLCFFASNAFASSADSGKCPWKIPFTITIHGIGTTHSYLRSETPAPGGYTEHDTDYGTVPDTDDYEITVDTFTSNLDSYDSIIVRQYSFNDDILRFFFSYKINYAPYFGGDTTSVTITFAPGTGGSGNGIGNYREFTFKISSLSFDDTSIYTSDSSFSDHNILITDNTENGDYYFWDDYDYTENNFTASSVTLSGIFRPTTFSDPPDVVTEAPQPNNLAIYSSNGSIACSFDVSDHARDLEIYSPLGIREASITISPGETGASLPHLPAGFYFVRLEGSMAKVYIAGY